MLYFLKQKEIEQVIPIDLLELEDEETQIMSNSSKKEKKKVIAYFNYRSK
jgi:hypothetical protein